MSSSPWEILGIAATHDERAIKRAYAQALKRLDPDDRDDFIALRAAYEQVLEEAMEIRYWQEETQENEAFNFEHQQDDAQEKIEEEVASLNVAQDEGQSDEEPSNVEMPHDDARYQEDERGHHFIQTCWESWESSGNEDELLARLKAQHEALNAEGIHTAIDYSDSLQEWFYQHEDSLPRAFAWAADVYHWQFYDYGWRIQALYERYPILVNPQLASYPALARWDENWQQGFGARLFAASNAFFYGEVKADLKAYQKDSVHGEGAEVAESVAALTRKPSLRLFPLTILSIILILFGFSIYTHVQGYDLISLQQWIWMHGINAVLLAILALFFFYAWHRLGRQLSVRKVTIWTAAIVVLFLLASTLWMSSSANASWFFFNLAALLLLVLIGLGWHYFLGEQWLQSTQRMQLLESAIWGLALFTFWGVLSNVLDSGLYSEDAPRIAAFALALPLTGAGFAYQILRRTPLSPQVRTQYVITLCYGAILLPFFWLMLLYGQYEVKDSVFAWMVKLYFTSSIIGAFYTPIYRQWRYWLPLLLGIILFFAFTYHALTSLWLLRAQLGLWLLMPFAILLTPRYPRLGFILPQTLRVMLQAVLLLFVPLVFWQSGWYIAFALSIALAIYMLWLDEILNEEI